MNEILRIKKSKNILPMKLSSLFSELKVKNWKTFIQKSKTQP